MINFNLLLWVTNYLLSYIITSVMKMSKILSVRCWNIWIKDSTNQEEEEVCKLLRECLDLRKKYVFREELSPSMMSTTADSSPSDSKRDLFHFESVKASDVSLSIFSLPNLYLLAYTINSLFQNPSHNMRISRYL